MPQHENRGHAGVREAEQASERAVGGAASTADTAPGGAGARHTRSAAEPLLLPHADRFYPPREVSALLGVSRRQLQYWARTDLVRPSGRTPGGHHRYSFEDLVALKAVVRLIDAGVSVQKVRTSIDAIRRTLPEVSRPLSELVLVATGDVVLVFSEGTVFEAISGQEWVFDVAQFRRDVDAWNAAAGRAPVRGVRPVRRARRGSRGAV